MNIKIAASISIIAALAACAKSPDKVQETYVSPVLYESLSCKQLASEAVNVSNRAHDAVNLQRRHHSGDEVKAAAGLVIFWPTLLFIRGNDENTAQIAQLRGEAHAIEQASNDKNCGIVFQR